jgi:hypothetical protein
MPKSLKQKFFRQTVWLCLILALAVFLFPALPASAQLNVGMQYGDKIGLGDNNPVVIVIRIIQLFLGFLALIAVVLFIYAGFIYMTAGGDAAKVEKAKAIIKNVVIGLVIILASFGIVSWIFNILNTATRPGGPNGPRSEDGNGSGIGGIGN